MTSPGAPGDRSDARPPARPGRVAVVGDVGGQLGALTSELVRLGADPTTFELPDDLTVVQVGDLVHRGPDSDGVVALVDHLLTTQPGRWVQLIGNHEAQYVREPAFQWPERIGEAAELTLWDWWNAGQLHGAAAVRVVGDGSAAGDGDVDVTGETWLISHAGLTAGFWREALDSPTRPEDAARAIDSFRHGHEDVLFHHGMVLGGGPVDLTAGPVWAAAGEELIASWLAASDPLPFGQVHGHSAMTDWRRGRLHAATEIAAVTTIDRDRAHETTVVDGHRIVGVDPRHGKKAHRPWEAFVLEDAVVSWPS